MDYKHYILDDEENLSTEKIFCKIANRGTVALMLHDSLSTYFDFLGLCGFSKYHEYRYFDESNERVNVKKYYMKKYGKIIYDEKIDEKNVIPKDWKNYKKDDVQPQNKAKFIKDGFEIFKKWEEETVWLYTEYAKWIFNNGCLMDFEFIFDLIKGSEHEINFANEILYKMQNVNYNIEYIEEKQHILYENYEKMLKKIF